MITKEDIEKWRSPRGLRQFVCRRKAKVKAEKKERHNAIKRKGIYNDFIKEIVPLSIFALKAYPNTYRIKPVGSGNQGYDAIIKDANDNIVDYVEITFPDDWRDEAEDAKRIVSKGYGKCKVFKPGEDIDELKNFIQEVCAKKATKDYSDCTLVIVIAIFPYTKSERLIYADKINQVVSQIQSTSFKAKRIFLLLLEQHKLIAVK